MWWYEKDIFLLIYISTELPECNIENIRKTSVFKICLQLSFTIKMNYDIHRQATNNFICYNYILYRIRAK